MPPQGDTIESSRTETRGLPARAATPTRRRLNPRKLAYLIGPAAFLVILLLMRVGYTARESAWTWLGVFAAIVAFNVVADHFYDANPCSVTLNLRVVSQVTAVTAVIYLTGWGPVLWGAYAFIALENVARGGSRVWRTTALWSLAAMAVGQFQSHSGLAPVRADSCPVHDHDRLGCVHASLRDPDGRGHHGTEGKIDGAEGRG